MSNSLEVRVPLIDHELAKLCFSLPSDLKIKSSNSKYLLKRVAEPYISKSITNNRKRGFSPPINSWFLDNNKNSYIEEILNPSNSIYQYLDHAFVSSTIRKHNLGMRDYSRKIWSIVVFSSWLNNN